MRSLLLLVCLLLTASASRAEAETALSRAERAFDTLEFDTASAAFRDALREPGTRDERLRAWRGLALSEAFMGQADAAQQAFESLLTMDPKADVNRELGPKVRQPFEAARSALEGRPSELKLTRAPDGRMEAVLEQARPLAVALVLYVRQPGDTFVPTRGRAPGPVVAAASPVRSAEAFAVAMDAAGGVIFEVGSAQAPLSFEPTEALLAGQAREGGGEEGGRRVWPWVLGGAGVVAAGVVAGVLIAQPPALNLPPADRTGRLP